MVTPRLALVAFVLVLACTQAQGGRRRRGKDDTVCTPGSRWMDQDHCNWCGCSDDGKVSFCTLKFCFDHEHSLDEKTCEDGSRWKQDCNWCRCANGKQLCTKRLCADVGKDDAVCTPGSSWLDKDHCNSCGCSDDGKAVFCTKKACVAHEHSLDEKTCEEGSRWKQDCNWCRCANGKQLCTKRLCATHR